MTAVSEIIEDAFYKAGLTTETQHATPTQTRRAMTTFAAMVKFLYGPVAGENLAPWPIGNYGRTTLSRTSIDEQTWRFPPINSNIVAVNENAFTGYFPVNPSDGARIGIIDPFNRLATVPVTLDGNGRTIEGASQVVLNVNGTNRTWFYRADTGNWARLNPLTLTDEMPFPEMFDEMFKLLLAADLNPIYGKNMGAMQLQFLKEYRQQFTARYVQSAPLMINPEVSLTSRQSYETWQDYWYGGGTTQEWERGYNGNWWWW